MAVAELPAHSLAFPGRTYRAPSRPSVAPNLAWIPLVGVLLGIASLFYVAQTGEVATAGYGVQQYQSDVELWQMRNAQLALELSQAKSLTNVETQAKTRLLMVPAREPIFLKTAQSDSGRSATSSRGNPSAVPALEKPSRVDTDPLDPVLSSVSVLIPRSQASLR